MNNNELQTIKSTNEDKSSGVTKPIIEIESEASSSYLAQSDKNKVDLPELEVVTDKKLDETIKEADVVPNTEHKTKALIYHNEKYF